MEAVQCWSQCLGVGKLERRERAAGGESLCLDSRPERMDGHAEVPRSRRAPDEDGARNAENRIKMLHLWSKVIVPRAWVFPRVRPFARA